MLVAEKNIVIIRKKIIPKPSIVYDTYWRFASERQKVFFQRMENKTSPWSDDPILKLYKFTNAYRASDRVSQYLIKDVIYKGEQTIEEIFFRIILFKIFNKIETWEVLEKHLGKISYREYSFEKYDKILRSIINKKVAIYSGAYIMASGKSFFGYEKKYQNHLRLIEMMMNENVPTKIVDLKSMSALYELLKGFPTIGEFLAYQYATDINYSSLTSFSEMEFVKAGPGAKDGIRKCFSNMGEYSEEDIIKLMADRQDSEFERLGIEFKNLWGRPLQLIDCQNLFCEVDKYSRVAHPQVSGCSNRMRIKQKFIVQDKAPIEFYFPPKWGINHLI